MAVKRKRAIFIIYILVCSMSFLLLFTACGTTEKQNNNSTQGIQKELDKIPENYPIDAAPVYMINEMIRFEDNTLFEYESYELVYNSSAEYDDICKYYDTVYTDTTPTDFGIAKSYVHIPKEDTGYVCIVTVQKGITEGTKGKCTVEMTVNSR